MEREIPPSDMGAIARIVAEPLKACLDLRRYRFLVTYPGWNYLLSAIIKTRAYEAGLELCLRLLSFAETHRSSLTDKEHDEHVQHLLLGVLTMLDKLDRWEEFLKVWDDLRAKAPFTFVQPRRPPSFNMEPFTVREDGNLIHVHFLWVLAQRKEVIERKLAKKRAGRKLGNLMHARQENLSDEEIRQRWERAKDQIRYAEKLRALINLAKTWQQAG